MLTTPGRAVNPFAAPAPFAHVPGWLSTRVGVPADLESVTTIGHEDDPESAGLTRHRVERMWRAALDLYRTGAHPALTMTLRVHGKVVLNRAVGHAWGNAPGDAPDAPKILAEPSTPVCVFSSAKGFTATLAHALVERGAFGLDDRVADWVPGYERHGKGETTVRQVLTHRAGVPFLPARAADLERIDDHEFVLETMRDLRLLYRPGTRLAYHALTGGYIVGEVIRAATGKDVRANLAELVLDPLGFRWSNYGVAPEDVAAVAPCHRTGLPIPPPVSYYIGKVLSGSFGAAVHKANDPRFLTAVIPSANTVTTSEEMARFYEILVRGGELDGVRVLSPQTLHDATRTTAHLEPDLGLGGAPIRYGVGYMMGAEHLSLYGQHADRAFGHLGLMNTIGWADPDRALAGALITTGKAIVYPGVERFFAVPAVVAACVPKVPESELPF